MTVMEMTTCVKGWEDRENSNLITTPFCVWLMVKTCEIEIERKRWSTVFWVWWRAMQNYFSFKQLHVLSIALRWTTADSGPPQQGNSKALYSMKKFSQHTFNPTQSIVYVLAIDHQRWCILLLPKATCSVSEWHTELRCVYLIYWLTGIWVTFFCRPPELVCGREIGSKEGMKRLLCHTEAGVAFPFVSVIMMPSLFRLLNWSHSPVDSSPCCFFKEVFP